MIEEIPCKDNRTLDDYAAVHSLSESVRDLRAEASVLLPRLKGRRLVMVNSTARGGGVAEMMPRMVSMLNELGLETVWYVMNTDEQAFFSLTKRIHNLIHGQGRAGLGPEDRAVYEKVNDENAADLKRYLRPDDILAIHDPQPMGMARMIKEETKVATVWRCHIGLDRHTEETRDAWLFLKEYADGFDRGVFSAAEYIPDFFTRKSRVIFPAIDPLGHKNRELPIHKLSGILANADLIAAEHPVLSPAFPDRATRLQANGEFAPATQPTGLGLLYSPIITQISRWDKLKGFRPLMEGFVRMKRELDRNRMNLNERQKRRRELMKLVLAGPDPASIQDDPEGKETLRELCETYVALPPEHQRDIALLTLPMQSRKYNALMVNALQRCSSVVVQNSLREGFGLTVAEAMWKGVPVLGSTACGIRQQIRDGVDGLLIKDATNPEEVADKLSGMMNREFERWQWGRNGQRRVSSEFLVFKQLRNWLSLLADAFGD